MCGGKTKKIGNWTIVFFVFFVFCFFVYFVGVTIFALQSYLLQHHLRPSNVVLVLHLFRRDFRRRAGYPDEQIQLTNYRRVNVTDLVSNLTKIKFISNWILFISYVTLTRLVLEKSELLLPSREREATASQFHNQRKDTSRLSLSRYKLHLLYLYYAHTSPQSDCVISPKHKHGLWNPVYTYKVPDTVYLWD